MCSFGYATRHVLKKYANNDVSKIKAIKVMFKSRGENKRVPTAIEESSRLMLLIQVNLQNSIVENCKRHLKLKILKLS